MTRSPSNFNKTQALASQGPTEVRVSLQGIEVVLLSSVPHLYLISQLLTINAIIPVGTLLSPKPLINLSKYRVVNNP